MIQSAKPVITAVRRAHRPQLATAVTPVLFESPMPPLIFVDAFSATMMMALIWNACHAKRHAWSVIPIQPALTAIRASKDTTIVQQTIMMKFTLIAPAYISIMNQSIPYRSACLAISHAQSVMARSLPIACSVQKMHIDK